jgi:plastocyanin
MALEKIRPRVVDATGNYTFNNVTLTGNISSPTANIGNVTGVDNIVASSSSITVTGSLSTTANITAGNIKTNNLLYANGSPWQIGTTTTVSGSNSQVQFNDSSSFGASANFTFDKTSNTLTVTNLVTNGSGITNITGSSVTGQVPNALIAATVYTNSQPNITSVGTLSSLTVTGSINSGNADLGNTATANYFVGSGNNLSNIQGSNITGAVSYATTANSVSGSNVSGAVTYAATANAVAGANVLGQVANSIVAGTIYTAAQPNITSVGTLTSLAVTGNITSGNANLGNLVTANFFTGNGSLLSSLTFGNITTFSTAGITTDELYLPSTTRLNVTASGASGYLFDQYGATLNPAIYVTSGQTLAFNLNVSGHPFLIQTSGGANYSTGLEHVDSTGTVLTTSSAQGQVAGTLYWKVPYGITGNYKYICSIHGGMNGNIVITDANVANITVGLATYATTANAVAGANVSGQVGNALVASTVYTNAQPNITSVGTLSNLAVTGNISAGNVLTNNLLYANGVAWSFGGGASISNGNSNVNIATSGGNINFSADGTANVMTITGTGANINGYANISGNVNAGNANLGNLVTANYFTGDGGLLSNIAPSSSLVSGNSNVKVSTSSDISFSMNGTSNVVVLTSLGANINGYANITGNVTFGNLIVSTYANLGSVSGLTITGGSNNYVLQTNGNGALSWAPLGALVTLDTFSGNGVQTTFTLSTTPATINHTIININGVQQFKNSYSLTGNSVIFSEAPPNTSYIEITTFAQRPTVAGYINRKYIGNGSANTYTVTAGCGENDVLVFLNGLCQMPVDGYTISGSSLTFSFAISAGTEIQIRELPR